MKIFEIIPIPLIFTSFFPFAFGLLFLYEKHGKEIFHSQELFILGLIILLIHSIAYLCDHLWSISSFPVDNILDQMVFKNLLNLTLLFYLSACGLCFFLLVYTSSLELFLIGLYILGTVPFHPKLPLPLQSLGFALIIPCTYLVYLEPITEFLILFTILYWILMSIVIYYIKQGVD